MYASIILFTVQFEEKILRYWTRCLTWATTVSYVPPHTRYERFSLCVAVIGTYSVYWSTWLMHWRVHAYGTPE